jgi:hypothetical protein
MKRFLLTAGLVFTINCAYATDHEGRSNTGGVSSQSGAQSIAGAVAGSSALISGSTSLNVSENQNDHIIPVSSAVAPSVASNTICPIISPSSHAVQFLVFGGSTTGSSTVNPICVAYHLNQHEVMEKMACKFKEYADANVNCAVK